MDNDIQLTTHVLFDEPVACEEDSPENIVGIFSNNFGSLDFNQIVVKQNTSVNGSSLEITLRQLEESSYQTYQTSTHLHNPARSSQTLKAKVKMVKHSVRKAQDGSTGDCSHLTVVLYETGIVDCYQDFMLLFSSGQESEDICLYEDVELNFSAILFTRRSKMTR